jgi:hypothetical protein
VDAGKRNLVRIVRTIVAVVLALAVAAMPAAAGAMAVAGTMHGASAAATAHSDAMPPDCAHHHAPADRGSKGTDTGTNDCAAMAACAVHCFTYAGTAVPGIALMPKASALAPLGTAGRIASSTAIPPFRPPRV